MTADCFEWAHEEVNKAEEQAREQILYAQQKQFEFEKLRLEADHNAKLNEMK